MLPDTYHIHQKCNGGSESKSGGPFWTDTVVERNWHLGAFADLIATIKFMTLRRGSNVLISWHIVFHIGID